MPVATPGGQAGRHEHAGCVIGRGHVEPQVLQNQAAQSWPGLLQCLIDSTSLVQRNDSIATTTTAMPSAPVSLRQIAQWQR